VHFFWLRRAFLGHRPRPSTFGLSSFAFRLSTFNFYLSTFSFQLLSYDFQLSTIHFSSLQGEKQCPPSHSFLGPLFTQNIRFPFVFFRRTNAGFSSRSFLIFPKIDHKNAAGPTNHQSATSNPQFPYSFREFYKKSDFNSQLPDPLIA
jgi:hypothetical protein